MRLFLFLLVGLLLGPTLLKVNLRPEAKYLFIFASYVFLFASGLELKLPKNRSLLPKSLIVAVGAFFIPIVGSLTFLYFFGSVFGIMDVGSTSALVFSVAISVSAVPVIIQLLKDFNYYNTETGHLVLSAAIFCDFMAWLVFAYILGEEQRHDWLATHVPIALFFVGMLISASRLVPEKIVVWTEKISQSFFAPVFFISIGLKIDLFKDFHWRSVAIVIALAVVTKVLGAYVGALICRLPQRQSWTIASLLNARGAMEVLLASFALQMGLIDSVLFTSLIAMAFGTTLMVGALLKLMK